MRIAPLIPRAVLALVLGTAPLVAQRTLPSRPIARPDSARPQPLALDDVARRRPRPAPREVAALVGEYGAAADTVVVLERGGRLFGLERGREQPLTARAFERDSSGRGRTLHLGSRSLPRRPLGTDEGITFRVTPLHPVDELRRAALAAAPPHEPPSVRAAELVELVTLDPTIRLDIRYASTNNFLGAPMYSAARAFMQRPAAEAVVRVHRALAAYGYGLLIHDAYRPWYVTRMFWDATAGADHEFVADPAEGSRHNRGAAVDLTLCDRTTGRPIRMTGGYDEFSRRSYAHYAGGTALERWNRDLLRRVMEAQGFTVNPTEWWHFDYHTWRDYPILNVPFDAVAPAR
ncbi:MAG: M15 family metallopeptidase [Gemmatimonadetes bacterium]|nr:M15 family metallopeptidase [Gemmatimonadota bacterium]